MKKKKFFDYVDKEYKAKNEDEESEVGEVEEGNQFSKGTSLPRKRVSQHSLSMVKSIP